MNSENVSTKFGSGLGFVKCLKFSKAGGQGEGRRHQEGSQAAKPRTQSLSDLWVPMAEGSPEMQVLTGSAAHRPICV